MRDSVIGKGIGDPLSCVTKSATMYCHSETMNNGTSLGMSNIAPFFGGNDFFFHVLQRARFFYTKHCSPVAAGFFFTRTWLAAVLELHFFFCWSMGPLG